MDATKTGTYSLIVDDMKHEYALRCDEHYLQKFWEFVAARIIATRSPCFASGNLERIKKYAGKKFICPAGGSKSAVKKMVRVMIIVHWCPEGDLDGVDSYDEDGESTRRDNWKRSEADLTDIPFPPHPGSPSPSPGPN